MVVALLKVEMIVRRLAVYMLEKILKWPAVLTTGHFEF